MGAQGTATLNFGAFPGSYDTSVDVVATGVVSTSLVEAWMHGGTATAEHSIDEHMVETVKVWAKYLSDGNIRIYGFQNTEVFEKPAGIGENQSPSPVDAAGVGVAANYLGRVGGGGKGPVGTVASNNISPPDTTRRVPRIYGNFTVAWVWN